MDTYIGIWLSIIVAMIFIGINLLVHYENKGQRALEIALEKHTSEIVAVRLDILRARQAIYINQQETLKQLGNLAWVYNECSNIQLAAAR